jgi:hypothetical protein
MKDYALGEKSKEDSSFEFHSFFIESQIPLLYPCHFEIRSLLKVSSVNQVGAHVNALK